MAEGVRDLLGVHLIRLLIPFMRVATPCPNHLQTAPLPNMITFRVVTTYKFGGGIDIWRITERKMFLMKGEGSTDMATRRT